MPPFGISQHLINMNISKITIAAILSVLVLPAKANCLVADSLIKKHGISFSGFKTNLPKVLTPQLKGARIDELVVIALPNKKGAVPDGFSHSALINVSSKNAWIHRVGGFVAVNEWYGPVELEEVNLNGCKTEKYVKR